MSETLRGALVELAQARWALAGHAAEVTEKEQSIASSPAGLRLASARERLVAAKQAEAEATRSVRELAYREWELTGDKHPGGHVTMREGKSYEVDEDTATLWARDVAPVLLKLDTAMAVKYAEHVGQIPGVERVERVTAAIDRDLSDLLKEDSDETDA